MSGRSQYAVEVYVARHRMLDKYTFALQTPVLPENATAFTCTDCLRNTPADGAAYMYGKRRLCRPCLQHGAARYERDGVQPCDVAKDVTVYSAPPAYFARPPLHTNDYSA